MTTKAAAPAPTPEPPAVQSLVKRAESALTKLAAACGFVASLIATAKGALPTDVGTASTIVTAAVFYAEHHWDEIK